MNGTDLRLPQQDGGWFLTDGGLETVLIFQEGIALPEFAAFVLLAVAGRARATCAATSAATSSSLPALRAPASCSRARRGVRASIGARSSASTPSDARAQPRCDRPDAGARSRARRRASGPIVVSGCIGPRGDGYVAGAPMALDDAQRVHQPQVDALADAGADMITAITMTTSAEGDRRRARRGACGPARRRSRSRVETDGTLPSGESLRAAIDAVDADAAAGGRDAPAYYMMNCAHPSHFERVLGTLGERRARLRGAACQRLAAQSCGARRGDRARCRQSARARRATTLRLEVGAGRSLRHRRLLRHGSSARGGHELGARAPHASRSAPEARGARSRRRGLAC